jgi:DNA repair protein RadC
MGKKIKLVETRLNKNLNRPIEQIDFSGDLLNATAAHVLSRKTDSAAFVYLDTKGKIANMQVASIKTLEKHKAEVIALAISHNAAAVLVTTNIKYDSANLKAREFMDSWQQAFFNNGFNVLEHLQTWKDENGNIQYYSFADEYMIKNLRGLDISPLATNDVSFSKSKFFSSRLELKDTGEFDIGEVGDLKGAISAIAEDMSTRDKEHVYVLSVDENKNPINVSIASIGGLNETYAQNEILFRVPILSDAKGLYFIHNHPSGDTTPSNNDRFVLKKLIVGGKELGLKVHDGLIIGAYNADVYSIINDELVDDSYYNNVIATSLKEEVFQYQVKENGMQNKLEKYANENYEGFIKDLISLEKGIKDQDTLNQIYSEYMKQDDMQILSKELDDLIESVDKAVEKEKSQSVYLNVHNSFAKLSVESKYEQGKTYNLVRLPEGSVIGDKDYSGASFYPLDKYIYPNKFNENLTTVQFKSGQDIKLYFKDRKPETVKAEDVCKAVDNANKKYLEQKTEKESGDKEKKPNEALKQKRRQKDLGEEL